MSAPDSMEKPTRPASAAVIDADAAESEMFDRLSPEERAAARRAAASTARRRGGGFRKPAGGNGLAAELDAAPAYEKPRDFKGTFRKLLLFMGQFKLRLAAAIAFAIGSTAFAVVGPKVLSEATTALFDGSVAMMAGEGGIDYGLVANILGAALALYSLSAVCSWAESWIMAYVSQQTCYRLRRRIAEKIDRMPFGYFERNATGDVLSRITNDVDTLGQSLSQGITQLITSAVTFVGVLVVMFSVNWIIALIALAMVLTSAGLALIVVKLSQKHFLAQQSLLGQVDAQAEEAFSGHAVVRAFNREDETARRYSEVNDALYKAGWKSQFLSGLIEPAIEFAGNVGYVAVAVTGAAFAAQGAITVGDIQAFVQYVKNLMQPVEQLSEVSNVLQQMGAAAERIFEFLDEPEEEVDEVRTCAADAECAVEFDRVRFGYDPDAPVIRDFSACVAEGQTVAIVGPTGAGKTTVVKLLMRFYDVQAGAIRIGGHDVREFAREDVRGLFSMVLQETWLFKETIRENIRYGRLDATDEEVEAAARRACAHHFIQALPGGYDFVVNEDANNLSQGQRQLLTIARAILADRRMLILDEATSSVDTLTEGRIQQAMDNLMAGRTSFVIAHRLSTIKDADLILVMNHGDVVEQGTHDELLASGGLYAELHGSQFDDIDEPEAI